MRNAALHLEFERIVGALEKSAKFSIDEQTHLSNCSKCSAQMNKLQNLFAIAPKDFSETVPQAATATLLNIYRRPQPQPRISLINRLAGLLVFDDWKPEFALNERLSFQDTRQLLYRAGDYNIDLRLSFADEKFLISGQIFPEVSATLKIYNEDFSHETELNEYGEFVFPMIEAKAFNLQIVLEDETIEIFEIPIS